MQDLGSTEVTIYQCVRKFSTSKANRWGSYRLTVHTGATFNITYPPLSFIHQMGDTEARFTGKLCSIRTGTVTESVLERFEQDRGLGSG